MRGNVFVNEVRVSLDKIKSLKALQYRAAGLSTGHKKRLEHLLVTEQGRVSIFEGDVLFCLVTGGNIEKDKVKLSKFLSKYVRTFDETAIEDIELERTPERVIKRLTFAIVSFQAASRGIFTIYGRTLFKPTPKEGKLGHRAVETTMVIEDGVIKIYFTPTLVLDFGQVQIAGRNWPVDF